MIQTVNNADSIRLLHIMLKARDEIWENYNVKSFLLLLLLLLSFACQQHSHTEVHWKETIIFKDKFVCFKAFCFHFQMFYSPLCIHSKKNAFFLSAYRKLKLKLTINTHLKNKRIKIKFSICKQININKLTFI